MNITPQLVRRMFGHCVKCHKRHSMPGLRFCSRCGADQKELRGLAALVLPEEEIRETVSHPDLEKFCSPKHESGKHHFWVFLRQQRNPNAEQRWNYCPCCGEKLDD